MNFRVDVPTKHPLKQGPRQTLVARPLWQPFRTHQTSTKTRTETSLVTILVSIVSLPSGTHQTSTKTRTETDTALASGFLSALRTHQTSTKTRTETYIALRQTLAKEKVPTKHPLKQGPRQVDRWHFNECPRTYPPNIH